jgi:hypothetical protein
MPNPTTRQLIQLTCRNRARSITLTNIQAVSDYGTLILVFLSSQPVTIDQLTISGVTAAPLAQPLQVLSINNTAAGQVQYININNVSVKNPSNGGYLLRTQGSSSQVVSRVNISDCFVEFFNSLLDIVSATTVGLSNIQMRTAANFVFVQGTGALILEGGGVAYTGSNAITVAAGCTLRVRGTSIPVDITKVNSKLAGDTCYNTNAAVTPLTGAG